MKIQRHGQAAIISDGDYAKIRKRLSPKYQLLLDIARYTGERWGAIIQLRVEDVFNAKGEPKEWITFRAATRKASTKGKRKTRQVPLHPQLKELLQKHPLPQGAWLFPSERIEGQHIILRAADAAFRKAVEIAGLNHKGYSTHSTRRTFITRLWEKGVDIHTIQLTTGHHDIKMVANYIQADPERIRSAISVL